MSAYGCFSGRGGRRYSRVSISEETGEDGRWSNDRGRKRVGLLGYAARWKQGIQFENPLPLRVPIDRDRVRFTAIKRHPAIVYPASRF